MIIGLVGSRAMLHARASTPFVRLASTTSIDKFKVVVVGGGSGGLAVANQIYNRFKRAGKSLNPGDIAVLDAAEYHYYQPGWTLAGAGLRPKSDFQQPLASLFPSYISHIPENVATFSPTTSSVTTSSGTKVGYESLVVAAGLKINWNAIAGLSQALADHKSGVSSIYSYDTCDKVWGDISNLQSGNAIFTQPAGVIKCAGAPQKIMWMAWDHYQKTGRGYDIKVDFVTGMPSMFSVKKYSDALNALRIERGIGADFQHNLVSIDAGSRRATFKKPDGTTVDREHHPIADATGWVDVDTSTLRHVKYGNVFSLGDCPSLPTSKTAAAITSQAPVVTENLFSLMTESRSAIRLMINQLLTGYGELMLAEFKYGLEPKESFAKYLGDQTCALFYHFKKDLFPWAYWNRMIKGTWFGPSGPFRPHFD
ncbi:hypothetical protein EV401DRAFT_2077942 [Pisolithus croceorrhizus]|nr:hypothetical protein EV401DRAFT_2077942 [Pisolithus croceorrhizus]